VRDVWGWKHRAAGLQPVSSHLPSVTAHKWGKVTSDPLYRCIILIMSQRYKKWKSWLSARAHHTKLRERTAVFTSTLSSRRSFCTAGPARPQPLALSEPLFPDESRHDAASRLLSPVLIRLRWLPEECPFLRSTAAVPATWDCVCTNALPGTIKTMNYEHNHGSDSKFSINMTLSPWCHKPKHMISEWQYLTIFLLRRNESGIHVIYETRTDCQQQYILIRGLEL